MRWRDAPVAAVLLLLLVPAGVGEDASVPWTSVAVPCAAAEDAATAAGVRSPTPARWSFNVTGAADGLGAYDLRLRSDRAWVVPNGTFEALDTSYSRFRGEMVTTTGVLDVTLIWESHARNVHHVGAQVAAHMVLAGVARTPEGDTLPLRVDVTFPAAPLVCGASAGARNYLHVCPEDDAPGPCVPAGWEWGAHLRAYHNGPVVYTGSVDGTSTAGAGHGRGVALMEVIGAGPL